jgi:hypothetical protein
MSRDGDMLKHLQHCCSGIKKNVPPESGWAKVHKGLTACVKRGWVTGQTVDLAALFIRAWGFRLLRRVVNYADCLEGCVPIILHYSLCTPESILSYVPLNPREVM